MLAGVCVAAPPAAGDAERDELLRLWIGSYDMSEQLLVGGDSSSTLVPQPRRLSIDVRRVQLAAIGTHVLYVEERTDDEPFERSRHVLLSIEPQQEIRGELRVRQFAPATTGRTDGALIAADLAPLPGCDLHLEHEGGQFRGGTRGRDCRDESAGEPRWLDYRVVVGDGLFWYRRRTMRLPDDELIDEFAGFPRVAGEARLFACAIVWAPDKSTAARRALPGVDLHDRGGRARLRIPDGRELQLELHGRDWPLSQGRGSLVLTLTDGGNDSDTIASSWTSLGAARVGIDIGWLSIDCAPVVSETGEQQS